MPSNRRPVCQAIPRVSEALVSGTWEKKDRYAFPVVTEGTVTIAPSRVQVRIWTTHLPVCPQMKTTEWWRGHLFPGKRALKPCPQVRWPSGDGGHHRQVRNCHPGISVGICAPGDSQGHQLPNLGGAHLPGAPGTGAEGGSARVEAAWLRPDARMKTRWILRETRLPAERGGAVHPSVASGVAVEKSKPL